MSDTSKVYGHKEQKTGCLLGVMTDSDYYVTVVIGETIPFTITILTFSEVEALSKQLQRWIEDQRLKGYDNA